MKTDYTIGNALVDRKYRGRKFIGDTKVEILGSGKATDRYYKKQKAKKKFRRRAGIESVIGHLKQGHRMQRNCPIKNPFIENSGRTKEATFRQPLLENIIALICYGITTVFI